MIAGRRDGTRDEPYNGSTAPLWKAGSAWSA